MMKQIKKNKVMKIATIILLFLSINLNAQSVDLELVNELVDNIKQGDLKSMKKLEAHLFGIILEIVEPYDNNYKENTFLKTIEYVNKKINLNFNATNENGDTFLIAASRQGSLKIVKSLIGYGADVNAKNNDGRTALMLTSNLEIAKLLIDSGADVNAKNNDGGTALMLTSNLEIAKLLIDNGADVNAKSNGGLTALMLTSSLEITKLLIDNGADVNAKDDEFGQTALTQAVKWDRLEIAKLLIDNGADINARGSGMFGNPPLIIGVINYMDNGPLLYYEYSEILEKIKFLIDKGADVNVKDNIGRSVLEKTIDMLNIQHWELVLEIVKLLVDNGANINAKDKNGNTALTYAKRKGNKGKEIVKFLMSRGAK